MEIQDKWVLVTGASGGIGAAIARAMARNGGKLILLARRSPELNQVAAEIKTRGGTAVCYPVDLADPQAVAKLAKQIATELGTPDIIVNNAGAGQWKFIEDTTPEEARQMMALPYFAAFDVTRAFIPEMLKRRRGHIVNISSAASRLVWPGATAYTAARWAMRGFTEALRADLRGTGIGVTLYESGHVDTPYWRHNPGSYERIPKIGRLLLRTLKPREAGAAVVDAVINDKRFIVLPFMLRVIYLQRLFLPWLVDWLLYVTGSRRGA